MIAQDHVAGGVEHLGPHDDDAPAVGSIVAAGKPEIHYALKRIPEGLYTDDRFYDDIEVMESVYFEPPFEWIREQSVGGEPVRLALTSAAHEERFGGGDRRLMAFYPDRGLNLSASVVNEVQIEEVLAVMLGVPGAGR